MYKLNDKDIDLECLDNAVNRLIPSGFNVHDNAQDLEFTEKSIEGLTFKVEENA